MRRLLALTCVFVVATALPAHADTIPSALQIDSTTPAVLTVGSTVTISGTVTVPASTPDLQIVVERSTNGTDWTAVTGTAPLTSSSGGFTVDDVPAAPGTYTYRASWAGDATYAPSADTSGDVSVLKYTSSLTLTRSPSTIVYGQQVTLKGAWSSAGGAPATMNLTIERHKVDGGTASLHDNLGATNNYRHIDKPPSAGTFTYTVTWPGDSEHFAATSPTVFVTVSRRPTTLSLDVTHPRVTVGDSTTLVATLRHAGSDASVRFQKRAGGTWHNIGTVPVGSDRTATLKVAPSEKKIYRAVFDATTSLKGSASDPVVVEVRPIMIGHMSGTFSRVGRYAVYQCCTAYFYARLKPIHPKAAWTAIVQYYGHGSWHRLGAGTYHFELDGDAAIFLNASSGYRYRVRARFEGDADHLPASSPWSYFRFVK
jgi:hypothetical protein